MKSNKKFEIPFLVIICALLCHNCVKSDDFDIPQTACSDAIVATKTIDAIFNIATTEVKKYTSGDVIEGFVISSDQEGNFFKNISVQTLDGAIGFTVPIDQTDLYTLYNPGRKVLIQLQGQYIQLDDNMLEIGSLFIDNFQNEQVGRIANPAFENIVLKSCETVDEEQLINNININQIKDSHLHTLVELSDVQFVQASIGKRFYESDDDISNGTNHLIQDASGASLIFRTSAFANFAQLKVPEGNGTIRGVLTKSKGMYQLIPRTTEDFKLSKERIRVGFADVITGSQITINDLRKLYNGTNTTITEEIFIEGIVTLSGFETNNISSKNAFIQDGTGAISLSLLANNTLEEGMLLKIGVQGLLLSKYKGLLEVEVTQNQDIQFINENQILPDPLLITIEDLLSDAFQSQLVKIDSVQFENENGTYSGSQIITDCLSTANLRTNSEASFSNNPYPSGNGTIVGIATHENSAQLLLRDETDVIDLNQERCTISTEPITTIFFSELADPNNNSAARFIEIYNSGTESVNLRNWQIKRFTNANTTSTVSIDLSGSIISPNQAFVIASNAVEFENIYGFAPNLAAGTGSPADSNGDDNLVLIDPNGAIIDIFGVIGEDGSNTNHEFEDGRALRNSSINQGNPIYIFSEWQLWNDTGGAGTTNLPQDAPGVFTPGVR